MKALRTFALLSCIAVSKAFFFDFFNFFSRDNWNGLRVKFGRDPYDSQYFNRLPRTADAAVREGFTQISTSCENGVADWYRAAILYTGDSVPDSENGRVFQFWQPGQPQFGNFLGNRYMKDGDTAIVLLYDVQGYIAGIQAGIPDTQPDGYPYEPLRTAFTNYNGVNFITVYFVNPAIICTSGRSEQEFRMNGTGTNMYIQNGTNPERDSVMIPRNEADIGSTRWVKGTCFPAMGMHYWYDVTGADMSCDKFFPVFLLYNRGKLNGFGWAFAIDLPSQRYSKVSPNAVGAILKVVPTCLYDIKIVSSLHIYFTDTPRLNYC